jgi:voltage-gated potassium channel
MWINRFWSNLNPYATWRALSIPSSVNRLWLAALLLLFDILLGTFCFVWIEGYRVIDAFYQTIITISTVGFTEVRPFSDPGKIFVSCYILLNIGLFAYFVSVFSYHVIQGVIFKNMHLNHINRSIEKLSNHVIVCGYGKYGKEIANNFVKHGIDFVVIDSNPEKIETIQRAGEKVFYIEEDATHDEALIRAGITRAQSLISALPDDSDNLFVVLTARQLNPRINLISRAKDPKSQRKLTLAGANHVVMPEQIGGFYMSALVTKPGAVEFFSFITNEYRSDFGFEEIGYDTVPSTVQGRTISDLRIRQNTGANIIGFRDANGTYHVNPSPSTLLLPGCSFIILGDGKQLATLRGYLERFV